MRERILHILKIKNLTPSKFADEIGVQRSNISHILSERNKPSLELVQKILQVYTDIDALWLVTGKSTNEQNNNSTALELNFSQQTPNQEQKLKPEADKPKTFDLFSTFYEENTQIKSNQNGIDGKQNTIEPPKSQNIQKEDLQKQIQANNDIEKIIVFYTDKTFEAYIMR